MVDERFIEVGYSTTAYELMENANIFTKLERLSKYHDQVEDLKTVREDTLLNFYVKPTV